MKSGKCCTVNNNEMYTSLSLYVEGSRGRELDAEISVIYKLVYKLKTNPVVVITL
jgi:hypothetical protein